MTNEDDTLTMTIHEGEQFQLTIGGGSIMLHGEGELKMAAIMLADAYDERYNEGGIINRETIEKINEAFVRVEKLEKLIIRAKQSPKTQYKMNLIMHGYPDTWIDSNADEMIKIIEFLIERTHEEIAQLGKKVWMEE